MSKWQDLLKESYEYRNILEKDKNNLKDLKIKFEENLSFKKMKKYFPSLISFDNTTDYGTSYSRWNYSTGSIKFKRSDWKDITETPRNSTDLYYKETSIDKRFQNAKKFMKGSFFQSFTENLYKCDNIKEIEDKLKKYKEESKEFEEGIDLFLDNILSPITDKKITIDSYEKSIDAFRQEAKREFIKEYYPTLFNRPFYLKDKKGERVGYVKITKEDTSGLGYTVEDVESHKISYHVKLENLDYDFRDFNSYENELYRKE